MCVSDPSAGMYSLLGPSAGGGAGSYLGANAGYVPGVITGNDWCNNTSLKGGVRQTQVPLAMGPLQPMSDWNTPASTLNSNAWWNNIPAPSGGDDGLQPFSPVPNPQPPTTGGSASPYPINPGGSPGGFGSPSKGGSGGAPPSGPIGGISALGMNFAPLQGPRPFNPGPVTPYQDPWYDAQNNYHGPQGGSIPGSGPMQVSGQGGSGSQSIPTPYGNVPFNPQAMLNPSGSPNLRGAIASNQGIPTAPNPQGMQAMQPQYDGGGSSQPGQDDGDNSPNGYNTDQAPPVAPNHPSAPNPTGGWLPPPSKGFVPPHRQVTPQMKRAENLGVMPHTPVDPRTLLNNQAYKGQVVQIQQALDKKLAAIRNTPLSPDLDANNPDGLKAQYTQALKDQALLAHAAATHVADVLRHQANGLTEDEAKTFRNSEQGLKDEAWKLVLHDFDDNQQPGIDRARSILDSKPGVVPELAQFRLPNGAVVYRRTGRQTMGRYTSYGRPLTPQEGMMYNQLLSMGIKDRYEANLKRLQQHSDAGNDLHEGTKDALDANKELLNALGKPLQAAARARVKDLHDQADQAMKVAEQQIKNLKFDNEMDKGLAQQTLHANVATWHQDFQKMQENTREYQADQAARNATTAEAREREHEQQDNIVDNHNWWNMTRAAAGREIKQVETTRHDRAVEANQGQNTQLRRDNFEEQKAHNEATEDYQQQTLQQKELSQERALNSNNRQFALKQKLTLENAIKQLMVDGADAMDPNVQALRQQIEKLHVDAGIDTPPNPWDIERNGANAIRAHNAGVSGRTVTMSSEEMADKLRQQGVPESNIQNMLHAIYGDNRLPAQKKNESPTLSPGMFGDAIKKFINNDTEVMPMHPIDVHYKDNGEPMHMTQYPKIPVYAERAAENKPQPSPAYKNFFQDPNSKHYRPRTNHPEPYVERRYDEPGRPRAPESPEAHAVNTELWDNNQWRRGTNQQYNVPRYNPHEFPDYKDYEAYRKNWMFQQMLRSM